jgi:hypothetical protein
MPIAKRPVLWAIIAALLLAASSNPPSAQGLAPGKPSKSYWGDSERRTLLRVSRYDPMWQLRYHLAEELVLKKGTRLEVTSIFDNSPGIPSIPIPPSRCGGAIRRGKRWRSGPSRW